MARISIYGLEELQKKLERTEKSITKIQGTAIYAGADVLADAIKSGIQNIRTDGPSASETARRKKQKQGLIESFGIAPMQNDNGFINVKLGFDGYNDVDTPSYPKGQPNAMVARMYNSGTSSLSKQAFFDKAVRSARNPAKKKVQQVLEDEINKLIE